MPQAARWRKNRETESRLGGSTDGGGGTSLPPLPNDEADRELRGGPDDGGPGPLERREDEEEVLLAAEDVFALFECRACTGEEDPPLVGGRGIVWL